jgi:LacI family transcriptional regulator
VLKTLRDVAAQAGVSQATAARALGGYGYVSPVAKRAVLEAAEQLGYRPNNVARALASGTTKTIGLLVGDIENPFFAAAARGLSDIIEDEGYTLLLANSDEDLERERRSVNVLRAQLVDALVVAPVTAGDGGHLRAPDPARQPVVLLDRAVRGLGVDAVMVDNGGGAASAVRHLLSFGHERIGVVSDSEEISSTAERLRGYRRALREAGLEAEPGLVAFGESTRAGGYEAARRLLEREDRPHALFTLSNFMTAGAMMAIRDLGLRIPGDVALVAFDELEWATLVDPPVTVVAQPVLELGRTAGRRVLARLNGDQSPPKRVRLRTELIVRGSCGPATVV